MNDVGLDALRSEPARQPEAVVSGLGTPDGDACDPVAFLFGLRPPAALVVENSCKTEKAGHLPPVVELAIVDLAS